MSRNRKADKILQALLSNHTIREAAQTAQVSERVIYDYLKDPEFNNRYKAARDDITRGVANNLRGRMNEAVTVISDIMNNTENAPKDRLAAARAVLEYGARYAENQDIAERLKELEDIITEAQEQ